MSSAGLRAACERNERRDPTPQQAGGESGAGQSAAQSRSEPAREGLCVCAPIPSSASGKKETDGGKNGEAGMSGGSPQLEGVSGRVRRGAG